MSILLHRDSTEDNKHTPKGFTSASNNSWLTRDENGNSVYDDRTVLPTSTFVDGSLAPPTEVTGDNYVLIDLGGGAVHSNWDGAAYNDHVRFNSNFWINTSPNDGYLCFDDNVNLLKQYTTASGWAGVDTTISYNVCAIYDTTGTPTYYSTLQAAITAASAGETVQILADITETGAVEITLKDGVNINGNGHTYTLNNATASLKAFSMPTAMDLTISNLKIVKSTGLGGSCINSNNSANDLVLNGVTLENDNGEGIRFNGSSITGNWKIVITAGNYYALYSANSSARYTGFHIESFGPAYAVGGGGIMQNGYVKTTSSGCIFGGWTCSNVTAFASGGHAVYESGSTGYFRNCVFESSTASAVRGGGRYKNCSIKSTSNVPNYGIGGGYFENCTLYSTAAQGLYLATGVYAYNCVIRSDASFGVYLTSTSGILSNCHIMSKFNDAAGDGVQATASGSTISNCTFEITSSSAHALDSINTTSRTLNYTGCRVKGGAGIVSAYVTQGISNTEDNQGNILI